MGWVLWGRAQDHDAEMMRRYIPDLLADRGHMLILQYYLVPIVVFAGILLLLGGWTMLVCGVFARVVVGWHTTWFVNPLSHMYGGRPHMTGDASTNNWFVALLTFREGWHNNHHAFPVSARRGIEWYQFDLNWITIRLLERCGWATKIKLARAGGSQ